MRTSSQLTKIDQCPKNAKANVTATTDAQVRSSVQRQIVGRILRGEPIPDVAAEIDSVLVAKGVPWENAEQRKMNLALYSARVRHFCDWARTQAPVFPDEFDTVVDFFGEEVKALPDFFTMEDGTVFVHRIKTGRFKTEREDTQSNEAYVLGLCGEKLFPGMSVVVQFDHLADKDNKTEQTGIVRPYPDAKYQKISRLVFNDRAKEFFASKHESERDAVCTPEECASCAMFNVCNFEEPPISLSAHAQRNFEVPRLTYDQAAVVDFERGNARVNAGPGAGKTLVVALRIKALIEKGYQPEDLCILTFTKAGAEEMTTRAVGYCAAEGILIDPDRFTSTTFNAFCQKVLTNFYDELGYTRPPRVLPDETRSGIVNRLLDQFPHVAEWNYVGTSGGDKFNRSKTALVMAKKVFSDIKREGWTRQSNDLGMYTPASQDIIFQMYDEFDRILHERNFVEYDDQLLEVMKLTEIHPTVFEEMGFKHIIVDEFQDTNLPQIQLLNKICDTASFMSFMAVGDDSQSIFAFRHTSPEFMINFGDYFGFFKDFSLVENHRSASNIIDFANDVNKETHERVDKDLIATKPPTSGPFISGFYTQKEEYTWIADQIRKRIEAGQEPSDIAVLMSDKNELTAMASALTAVGVPSILMNPIPFVSNSRVAALCTFFDSFESGSTRGLVDYQNALQHGALKDVGREVIESVIEQLGGELAATDRTVGVFMEYANALDEEKVDECYQDFLEKVSYFETVEELSEFFRDFKLYGRESTFKREGKYAGVCLTTIHSAKGLEWDTTYLSLSHLDKPEYHKYGWDRTPEYDEVLRKWFVGTTRARKDLIMTGQYCVKFAINGDIYFNQYLERGYQLLGKNFGFSEAQMSHAKAMERAEAAEKSASSAVQPSGYFKSMGHMTGRSRRQDGDEPQKRPAGRSLFRRETPAVTAQVEEDLSVGDIEFS